jgi:hypothetical protein
LSGETAGEGAGRRRVVVRELVEPLLSPQARRLCETLQALLHYRRQHGRPWPAMLGFLVSIRSQTRFLSRRPCSRLSQDGPAVSSSVCCGSYYVMLVLLPTICLQRPCRGLVSRQHPPPHPSLLRSSGHRRPVSCPASTPGPIWHCSTSLCRSLYRFCCLASCSGGRCAQRKLF